MNKFDETYTSPLTNSGDNFEFIDRNAEQEQLNNLKKWRSARDNEMVQKALQKLKKAVEDGKNIMPPSIEAARAGVTTGEWGDIMRSTFGKYNAPTGISSAIPNDSEGLESIRCEVDRVSLKLGRKLKILIGKPGLDGHSNGAEQIAVRARDCGMEIVYDGIRFEPKELAEKAKSENVHVIGLSILSGSHIELVTDFVKEMGKKGLDDVSLIIGGIIPDKDLATLKKLGASKIYTPKDFNINEIMLDIVKLADQKYHNT